jgi:hypothetical protein
MATLAFASPRRSSFGARALRAKTLCAHILCARSLSPPRPLWRESSDRRSSAAGAGAELGLRLGACGAVGNVVGETGQAVFYGAGGVGGGIFGEVFGGASALFGGPATATARLTPTAARSRRRSMRPAQSQHPSEWSAALWEGSRPRAPITQPLPATPMHRQRTRPRTTTRVLCRLSLDGQLL